MSHDTSPTPDEMDLLKQQITELQTQCADLAGSRTARAPALLLLFAALIGGLAGAVGTWGFQHITAKTSKIGQIQAGRIPFDLFQETYKRGTVEFPVPFSKRPLVFVCEGGKPGAWITVKTDAISESMFVWAATSGPRPLDYQSEIEWIAIEP